MKLLAYLHRRRDIAMLLAAFLLLLLAAFKPAIQLQRDIYSYFLVADISQSMNTQDATLNGKPISRLIYTQQLMHEVVAALPCGSKVSIGVFAGVNVASLYTPIEVCDNFAVIQDTITHLDWRAAWAGNSRIRESMVSLATLLRAFPEPAQVVFFTDGEEAPKLHTFNTRDLSNFQGGNGWLLVGIGNQKGTPIPKFDEKNQLIGYWAADSFAFQPGVAQISESNLGGRNNAVASSESDRYPSKLDEDYLKTLAKEVNGQYQRGDNQQAVISAMKAQKPARRGLAPFSLDWILATMAALMLVGAYLPSYSKQRMLQISKMNIKLKKL